MLCETDAVGTVIRSYAYDLEGHPVAFTQDLGQGPKTFYIHTNARGDVICVTDDVQNWVKKFTYDPWGKITGETTSSGQYNNLACPFAYAGYFRDAETNLYYMPARYYSPTQRRFLTKDPHPGNKSNPITLNPYQYCMNNPVNMVDPSGQSANPMADLAAYFQNMHLGDCGVAVLTSGAALMRSGARGLASAGATISSGMQTALAGMRSMCAGLGIALGGMSRANAGVSALAGFNWGGMAAVGIRGGRNDFELMIDRLSNAGKPSSSPWPVSHKRNESIMSPLPYGYFLTRDASLNERVVKGVVGLAEIIGGGTIGYAPAIWQGATLVWSAATGESWMQSLYNIIYPPGR